MVEIQAAILERTISPLFDKINTALGARVDTIQIDICDGRFVKSKTYLSGGSLHSAKQIAALVGRSSLLELDMMIDWESPMEGKFEKWLRVLEVINPDRVVLHMGSTARYDAIIAHIKRVNPACEVGLGVHLHHTIAEIRSYMKQYAFSYIQVMGIEKVGFGGQGLSPKASQLLTLLRATYPTIPLSVDGGVKLENAQALIHAGATRLTVGSGLFESHHPAEQVGEFRLLTSAR